MEATSKDTKMLEKGYRTGGDPTKGIYMKPFANVNKDVAIQYVIVWQEKRKNK